MSGVLAPARRTGGPPMPDVAAEVAMTIHASRSKVWRSLTDPSNVRKYFMGATVATDWRQGHPITWSGEWKGTPFQDKGEILAIDYEKNWSAVLDGLKRVVEAA
jgi:uncharacterized protein YndB with AHSA1/START domain